MPIRFRCAYCNQLMGISTRKAGKVVRCPKCAGEIIVPATEGTEAPEPEPATAGPNAFEDQHFEQHLAAPDNVSATAATASVPVVTPPAAAPPKRLGLFMPMGMLILSVGVVVLLLILMFVLGLIIGQHSANTPDSKAAARAMNPANADPIPAG
jgi:phage FluMu protein Com